MGDLNDIVKEFLQESNELIEELDQDFLELGEHPTPELLDKIFRCMHTVKGTCGFFEFSRLERLTHEAENLLSQLREGVVRVDSHIVDSLLEVVDNVRQSLATIEATGLEGAEEHTGLIQRLKDLQTAVITGSTELAEETKLEVDDTPSDETEAEANETDAQASDIVEEDSHDDGLKLVPVEDDAGPEPFGEADHDEHREANTGGGERPTRVTEGSIRVDINLLDSLMNLAGELVLSRNQIQQFTTVYDDRGFLSCCQRLNLITTELQERVMQTRMQPIGNVWRKLPRVVRRLAGLCKKQVRVAMDGQDTELDKTILEAIKDPMTHFVRNAIDHGIETPEERIAAGKPAEGTVYFRAFQEGGQVTLEIADDGKGIPVERVREKAVERGVINAVQAARLSDQEVLNLIFLPGFSTAESVTNVSGRGVGMDVVRANIERIGGNVSVQTELGRGTAFKIKIPLTLAIIPALLVSSGGCRYALPQLSLLELVRLEPDEAQAQIEFIHGHPIYRLRGALLPLVYLNQELKRTASKDASDTVNIVVLRAGERNFGLVVDQINDTAEIVVKPLGKQLKNIAAFAGATILGDGTVALILDVLGLAQRARIVSDVQERQSTESDASQGMTNTERYLLFDVGENRHMAVTLSSIARLEEIDASAVEYSQGREVVQYRGCILPLCRLDAMMGAGCATHYGDQPGKTLSVLVHEADHGAVGIVVDQIVDIVEDEVTLQRAENEPWILGSGVLQDRVTDFLDVEQLVASRNIVWLSRPEPLRESA